MPRNDGTVELGIRDLRAAAGDHIAYFWETPEEFAEAVRFLERGLVEQDHAVVFGHAEANGRVLEVLEERGWSPARLRSEGRLSVLGPASTGDRMLERIGETFQEALDRGASMVRLLGNIGWEREDWPSEEDILRFEARVTEAASSFPSVVMCMYDVRALSGEIVLHGAFGTHPLTIHRNLVRENPMCEDVDRFLERLEARGEPSSG